VLLRFLIRLLRLRGRLRAVKSLHPDRIRSILIVELTRLGDVITMLPAVRLVANHFPGASITLLVDEQYTSFLGSIGLPANVHGIRRSESVAGFLRAVTYVRKLKADLALSMSPPKRNAAVTLTSGASRKVGYLTYVHSLTPYLESTPVEAFGCDIVQSELFGRDNIRERSLKVCRAMGITTAYAMHQLDLRRDLFGARQRRLLQDGLMPRQQFVVLHPFSGWKFRSWSVENFNRLAGRVLAQLNIAVVFLCEKGEEENLASSRSEFDSRKDVYFVASDDLVDTAVILKQASLVVCNDSGPLHLASAVGTPVVALFGPASPELTGPQEADGVFLYKQVECSPCDQCACVRPTRSCMTLITPEEVFAAVAKLLQHVPEAEAVANA
jgi:heptosyltransferase-1